MGMMPESFPSPDPHRETTGERLVRIETMMHSMVEALRAHMKDEEKELLEMKDVLKQHIEENGRVTVDVRELSRDVREMGAKLATLEKEVGLLTKSRTQVVAWAAGVSATISAL